MSVPSSPALTKGDTREATPPSRSSWARVQLTRSSLRVSSANSAARNKPSSFKTREHSCIASGRSFTQCRPSELTTRSQLAVASGSMSSSATSPCTSMSPSLPLERVSFLIMSWEVSATMIFSMLFFDCRNRARASSQAPPTFNTVGNSRCTSNSVSSSLDVTWCPNISGKGGGMPSLAFLSSFSLLPYALRALWARLALPSKISGAPARPLGSPA
mmetsp:Transcript_370/g.1234  ORF Transcript_370/g.1234 Transcript_370/m.1234 type:complete len:216 (-) Transcript_370:148-795(-)